MWYVNLPLLAFATSLILQNSLSALMSIDDPDFRIIWVMLPHREEAPIAFPGHPHGPSSR